MADPLSIATGSVGIITFAIRACAGAQHYLSAIKDRHKELAAAWDAARTLNAVLEHIDGFVTRIHTERPEDAAFLSKCLEDARGPLLELRKVVAKLEGFPEVLIPALQNNAGSSLSTATKSSGSLREKAKYAGRAMAYKFHQENVKDLQLALQQVTLSLTTAISSIEMNANAEQSQIIKSIQAEALSLGLSLESKSADICSAVDSLACQSQAAAIDLQVVARENGTRLYQLRDGLSSGISSINNQTSRIQEAIHSTGKEVRLLREELREELQAHGQAMLAQFETVVCQPKNRCSSGSRTTEAPQIANRIVQYVPPTSLRHAMDSFSGCRCRGSITRSSTSYLQLCGVSIFSRKRSVAHHEQECPLYSITQRRTRAVGARAYLQLGSLLSCLAEASFECSVGAGGCSFGPLVRLKNLVPQAQSPVCQEFENTYSWNADGGSRKRRASEVVKRMETMQRNILTLYQKGEASIHDVDEHIHNHLQLFIKYLILGLEYELLTPEVADASISTMKFYVDMGLTCDEKDNSHVTKSMSRQYGFSPLIETSTTLARSANLLVPYWGQATDQNVRLVSSIAQASDPIMQDILRVIPFAGPESLAKIIDVDLCMENISALAKAILIRSIGELESAIKSSPESLLLKTHGLTVLHLSIGWPLGLSTLLGTEARFLLNTPDNIAKHDQDSRLYFAWPFSYAAANQCAQSLDLVLRAGCDLYPVDDRSGRELPALSCALMVTSAECAEVFARHMAQRKRELFTRASLSHPYHDSARESDAKEPGRQISELRTGNVTITCIKRSNTTPLSLRPAEYADFDIYRLTGPRLEFFPILERHGFSGYNAPDQNGLRPIMNDLWSAHSLSKATFGEVVQEMLPWLTKHGCLDARPVEIGESPTRNIRINTGVTGWHYLAIKMVTSTWGTVSGHSRGGRTLEGVKFIATIAEGEASRHRDGCTCLCLLPASPDRTHERVGELSGGGCSPFSYLCKHYLQATLAISYKPQSFWHHIFRHKFHSEVNDSFSASECEPRPTNDTPVPRWQLEFLRLLTFEALEMTHICCSTRMLPYSSEKAILNHPDPEGERRRLSTDSFEADKARLLDELMTDFSEQLGRRSGSPQDLEDFIFNSWRPRISSLYDVNRQEVNAIRATLGGEVRTKVLPEQLERFFGKGFHFFDNSNNKEVPHCMFCNR